MNPAVNNDTDGIPNNAADEDFDGDGLTNAQENDLGTSGTSGDSDGDLVGDAAELANGSDPNNSGSSSSGDLVRAEFYFGDHSGSSSEKYCLQLTPMNGIDPRGTINMLNLNYGVCETKSNLLYRGEEYTLTLEHAGTTRSDSPDYDYTLSVTVPQPRVIDDPDTIICVNNDSTSFYAQGKQAYIRIGGLDLDIDLNYDGTVNNIDSEELTEADPGAFAAVSNRVAIALRTMGSVTWTGTAELVVPSGIEVYNVATGGTALTSFTFSSTSLPQTLYVTSGDPGAYTLKLKPQGLNSGDTVKLTVVKVVSVEWIDESGNQICETNNHRIAGVGVKYYPGAIEPTGEWNDKVKVLVTIEPAMSGVNVYLKGFDPDDPSANNNAIDNDTSGGDNRGASTFSVVSGVTDNSGQVALEFTVSHQPGDNHRVAATILNPANLELLNDDSVPASNDQVSGFEGTISDLLTVWRTLWIERDSMGSIPESDKWITGYVDKPTVEISTDSLGNQYSKFKGSMFTQYSGSAPNQDEFEGGKLYFKIFTAPGSYYFMGASEGGAFRITHNKNFFGCQFELWPALTSAQLSTIQNSSYGVYFKAQDDGNYSIFDTPVLLSMGALNAAYADAYIDIVYADAFNTLNVAPFKRGVTSLDMISTLLGSRDLFSSPKMWSAHVFAAFEGHSSLFYGITDVDLDPDGVINLDLNGGVEPYNGATPQIGYLSYGLYGIATPANTCAIFLETIRDANTSINQFDPISSEHVTAHEIGHTSGLYLQHDNSIMNLMNADPDIFTGEDSFSPDVIKHMRSVSEW